MFVARAGILAVVVFGGLMSPPNTTMAIGGLRAQVASLEQQGLLPGRRAKRLTSKLHRAELALTAG